MNQRHRGLGGAALLAATLLAACEVTNPGPVQDEFLADEAAQEGLIFGAQRRIATTIGGRVLENAYMAREVFPGGQTGAWGADVAEHAGHIQPFNGPGFTDLHTARFITETAIVRFAEAGASDARLYEAWLWNGWAYRYLGEWWCDAVLPSRDPTDTEPPPFYSNDVDPYHERAVESFTKALEFASTAAQRNAAYAGRAQANLWLGNWANALADAAAVTDVAFEQLIEQDATNSGLSNYMYEGNSGLFRSYSSFFTWFVDYFDTTGDPRVPLKPFDPAVPVAVGSLSGFGPVPYREQSKFTFGSQPFQLADYWEMQLIQAEAILRGAGGGDFNDAVALINDVRTRTGVEMAPVTAANAQEAWGHLMTERRIELWIEGRNAADERRWTRTPPFAGADVQALLNIPDWDNPADPGYTPLFVDNPRGLDGAGPAELCYDIPSAERDRNPNVPASGR
jgi:hypothetical protein